MVYWFERPFPLVPTPFAALPEGEKQNVCNEAATEMALAHNVLIRGLNSIYHQAPYVNPEDVQDFLGYAKNFVNVLTVHHDSEEDSFFPECERMAGQAGIMQNNVDQHQGFHDGLIRLQEYLTRALAGEEPYDGHRIVQLIDDFGNVLAQHLAEEVQCLLDLQRFGPEKMKGLAAALQAEGQSNIWKIGITEGIVFAFLGHDTTWENGLWAHFPPTPPGLKTLIMKGLYYWRSAWWKFSPCDQNFMPKPEPYAHA
ncbi:hypothetical protein JX265_007340 [Neoarthrinium moseri]|uniref:Hemerythrin-like domain-containing protein n=1 Tax=Neoarthrinium moseri TaxID=1658444 RepID=A0A9P9WK61_9PEZI|nr:uncharacterized protein JN550_009064 [Neoarthrinium moseri]KAI1843556.1 hypothetical protein JX266_010189 [Neoarthrinium moseri]KAI1864044.1 hypothetical protein JN550_009064 [Neoarthrinium moseri]KAI1867538.1 hypothetical protein JX265_007340 [Neoarthrinium moseri]